MNARWNRLGSELQGRRTQDDLLGLPEWITVAVVLLALAVIALCVGAVEAP